MMIPGALFGGTKLFVGIICGCTHKTFLADMHAHLHDAFKYSIFLITTLP